MKKIWLVLSQQERQYALALIIVFGITLIAVTWFVVISTTKEVATEGGTFRIGVVGQPTSLNPLLSKNEAERDMVRLLFSPLSQLAETIEPTRGAPESWTVRLKENLLWHDAQPVTSDDLIFTIGEIQDPSTNSLLFPHWQGVKVERLSEREVTITPPARSSSLLFEEHLRRLLLIPQHIFASIPPQNWSLSDYNLKPVGNGPYRFEKLTLENDGFLDNYTLSAFRSGAEAHAPYIQTIIIRLFKDKQEAETAFRYGKIDGLGGVDPYEAKSIDRPAHTILYQTSDYYAVFINQSQNDILRNPIVRNALSQAVPREELAATVLNNYGKAIAAPSLFLPQTPLDTNQSDLAAAGWTKNANGKLERATGIEPELAKNLELTVPDLPFLEHTARILKDSWEKLGFTVVIKVLPSDKVAQEIVPRRDYQLLLFGNIPQPREDLYPFWHSSQIFHPGLNLSLYKNFELDTLLSKIRVATSTTDRETLLKNTTQLLRQDTPAIFLYSPAYVFLTSKRLQGIEASSSFLFPADRFSDIGSWYLRTKRVFK